MSFDIVLQRFQNGNPAPVGLAALVQALETHGLREERAGWWSTQEFDFCVTSESGAFFLRSVSEAVIALIFEIARSGDMVMFPVMAGNPVILVRPDQAPHLPPDVNATFRQILVETVRELEMALRAGFDEWSTYRQMIIEE